MRELIFDLFWITFCFLTFLDEAGISIFIHYQLLDCALQSMYMHCDRLGQQYNVWQCHRFVHVTNMRMISATYNNGVSGALPYNRVHLWDMPQLWTLTLLANKSYKQVPNTMGIITFNPF